MIKSNYTQDKYKFSFVMPVYNVEDYLEETIESILSQTMEFESNCQLILVNDGSPDNSESICLKYRELYPDNIVYVKQQNKGVSAARNKGIEHVQGKYISFLDSDDLLSSDTLEKVYTFFEEHADDIDLVSIKLEFFEAKTGPHMLNYKFNTTKVVDIEEDYDYIQLSGGSSFVKASAVQGKLFFDEKLTVAEDVKFLTEIILQKMKYGVVSEPVYHYRKRLKSDSALANSLQDKRWYFNTPKYAHKYLIELALEKFGSVPKYLQFLLMYDLQWRFTQADISYLSKEEQSRYREMIIETLKYIDSEIILEQNNITNEYKHYILGLKHNVDLQKKVHEINGDIFFDDTVIYTYNDRHHVFIEFLEIENGVVKLEGRLRGLLYSGVKFGFSHSGKFIEASEVLRSQLVRYSMGEEIFTGNAFKIELPIQYGDNISACFQLRDGSRRPVSIIAGRHSRLLPYVGKPYTAYGDYLVCRTGINRLEFIRRSRLMRAKKELIYLFTSRILARSSQLMNHVPLIAKQNATDNAVGSDSAQRPAKPAREVPARRTDRDWKNVFKIPYKVINSVVVFRLAYFITNKYFNEEIWIISDRLDSAGDNGEALFRYINKQQTNGIGVYFAIKKESQDYRRLKSFGKVVDRDSWYYKLLFLHSTKIISSHADDFVINPFGKKVPYLSDLFNFKFVFLQHGIIKDDLSSWLNRYNKNIKLFVTSARPEQVSVLEGDYYYDDDVVKLTGLPRYDLLDNNPKKKLIVAPTWRKNLSFEVDPKTNLRRYNPGFMESEYFKFYNALLTDKTLNSVMEKYDITGEFYLHPSHAIQLNDFSAGPRFVKKDFPYDYKKAFSEGNLLVTDYSSVAFDFAYLRKPLIYSQFDEETFYGSHLYDKGYFRYDRDGFGVVCKSYKDTMREIIKTIEAGMTLEEPYKARVKSFYAHSDKHNSERVYGAINELGR